MKPITDIKYFCDMNGETREVFGVWSMRNSECESRFPGVKVRRYDSFSRMVGAAEEGVALSKVEILPITRVITYKKNPSLHTCNGKCRGGKCNGVCECRCGGKNHGINSV